METLIESVVGQEPIKELPRKAYDHTFNAWRIQAYKEKGLALYYFNPEEGNDFGLIEFKTPLNYGRFNDRPKMVFALSPDEFEKVNKVVENLKEMIALHHKKISLLKQMVPAIMYKLVEKNENV